MRTRPFYPTKSELPLLLDGRQSALVRPWKRQPEGNVKSVLQNADRPDLYMLDDARTWPCETSPFGTKKTILWCKEPFHYLSDNALYNTREMKHLVNYRWDNEFDDPQELYWRSSVSMPKSACRLWLKVLEVKVLRVQDIRPYDAHKLGFSNKGKGEFLDYQGAERFRADWINKQGSANFHSNPWIWYATVARIEKP